MQKPRRLVLTQVPERSEDACNEALKQLPAWFNIIAFREAHDESTPLPLPIALSPDEARLAHLEKLLSDLGYGCTVEVGAEPVGGRQATPAKLEPVAPLVAEPPPEPSPSPDRMPSSPPGALRRPTPATKLDAPAEGGDEGMESRRRSLGNRETLRLPAQQDEERVPPAMLVRVGVLGVLIVALCVLILRMGGGADEAPPVSDQPAPAWESVSGPTAHAPIPIAFLTFFIGIGVVGMVASSLGIFRPVAPGRRPRLDTKVGLFGLGLLGAGYALLITTSWNPTEKLEAQRRRPPPVFDAPSSAAAIPGPADDSPAGSPDTAHPAWTEVVGSLPEIPEPEVPDPVFTGLFDVLLPESAARRAGGSVEGPSCASRMDSLPAFSRLACRLEVREPLPGIDPTFRSLLASVMPKPQPPAQAAAAPSAATVESRKEAAPEAAKEVPEAPAPKAPADAAPRQQEQPPKVAAAPTAPPPPDARPPEPPMLSRDEVMRAWRLGALRLMAQVFLLGLLVGGIIAFLLRLLVRLYERQARLT